MAERMAFVTGGSGFIGGRLLRRLVADGWSVRALARSERSAAAVEEAGAEAARGDLEDVDAMRAGATGCDAAFHAAAFVEEWGSRADSKALYSATKAQAEEVVRSAAGIETVVVRPRLVWGPGDTTVLPGLIEAVRSKKFSWI